MNQPDAAFPDNETPLDRPPLRLKLLGAPAVTDLAELTPFSQDLTLNQDDYQA